MTDPTYAATREFVEQLIRSGLVLSNLCADLLEDIPPDAFPGEQPVEVLLEMLTGSVLPVTAAAGQDALAEANALVAAIVDRVIGDLRLAAEAAASA